MPVLPTYQQRTEAGGSLNVGASPTDFGAQTAQAAQRIAGALQDVGGAFALSRHEEARLLKEQQERLSQSFASDRITAFQLGQIDSIQTAKDNAKPGAFGFANSALADFDKNSSSLSDSMIGQTEKARAFAAAHINALRVQTFEHAKVFEAQETSRYNLDLGMKTVDGQASLVAKDPRYYSQAMGLVEQATSEQHPEIQRKVRDYAAKQFATAAGIHMLESDPKGLYELTGKALNVQPVAAQPPAAAAGAPTGSFQASATDPRGLRNNNPGNLRLQPSGGHAGSWLGQVAGTDTAFATFDSPQSGIRAMTKNLLSYQDNKGLNTVQGIVSRWAPPSENDTSAYVKAVSAAVGVQPGDPIDLHDPAVMSSVVVAMIQHENGKNPYDPGVVKQGVAAGLGMAQLNPQAPPPIPAAPIETVAGNPTKTGTPWMDAASPEQQLHWRNQAFTEMQRTNAGDRASLTAQTRDFQAMVTSGVPPPPGSEPTLDRYVKAYGSEGGRLYQAEVADYRAQGIALGKLQSASYSDRIAIINAAYPQPGPDFDNRQKLYNGLLQSNAVLEKRIAADPAAHVLVTAPKVQEAYGAMRKVMSDQQATDQDRRSAVTTFAQLSLAEQDRLGVGRFKEDSAGGEVKARGPRLLTNADANFIAGQFSKKPADAAQLVGALEKQWGSYWPQVYGQLSRDDKLPPAALVIPNMSDPFARETLARISDPKVQKELAESTPGTTKKDIEESLLKLNAPFWTSLTFQQGGIDTHSVVVGQQKALAALYVAEGKSPGDAAKVAFTQTVGWQYEFNGSLRIPKTQKPEVVSAGIQAVLDSAAMLDTSVPPSFRTGMTGTARAAAWADAIRAGGTWVTNGDESGATLHVSAKTDSGGDGHFAVRASDGVTPLSWSWSQLRDVGAKAMQDRIDRLARTGGTAERARMQQQTADEDFRRRTGLN